MNNKQFTCTNVNMFALYLISIFYNFNLILSGDISLVPQSDHYAPREIERQDKDGYVYYKDGRGWYKYHEKMVEWETARQTCQDEGAVLASPETAEILNTMMQLIRENTRRPRYMFTGINDLYSKGFLLSINGIPLESMNVSWAPGEPKHIFAVDYENTCLLINTNGQLSDGKCSDKGVFICYKKETIPDDVRCGTDYKYYSKTDFCYKKYTVQAGWDVAFRTCRREAGWLLSPTSSDEAKVSELFPTKEHIWLGATAWQPKQFYTIFVRPLWVRLQGGKRPLVAGQKTELVCQAVGARPKPSITWWRGGTKLKTVRETVMRPLWVRLQGGKRPLVAGQKTELVCQAVGARPKPSITWWRGGTKLKTVRETTSTDGNITNSILTFEPSIDDAGRVLSCRATQPSLPHSTHEDGWKMEIQHLPLVKLELGANLDASKVVEGSDVYIDCRVRANPWHTHVHFTHNDVIVKPGPGVLVANQSLVLQRVSRRAAGAYVCAARNALGEGSSEKLMLDVKYTPTCKLTQPAVLRAARGEIIEIECELDANPKESMTYHWWFNSSAHSKHELTAVSALNAAQSGTYLYMVNTSSDYGWVQCSGTNNVGRQTKPCLFHILPADKPSAVKACEITNVTYDSLTLNCTPGHDGGIRQYFLLQVFDMGTGLLLANVSSDDPDLHVSGLSASNSLSVSVRAYNRKGASEPLTLTSSLLKYPQRHTAQVPVKVELTTVLIIVLVSVGVVAAMTAVSATVFCCRHCNKNNNKNEKDKRQQDETSNMPLTGTKESDSVDSLDKNPDIIPLDGKISDSCSNKSSTTDYSSIRPFISKNPAEKYDSVPPNCDRFYDHNIDPCNHYIQVRPIEYRVRPTYQPNANQMTNFGPSIQSLGPMSSLGVPNVGPNDCHRPYDKVYEDWLKYKNALPLNTSGLLPAEQLMPPSLFAPPPPSLYSTPPPPLDLERYHLEPRVDARCSNSPPVRFNTDNTVYYNKMMERNVNTLPHLKRINGNTLNQKPAEPKQNAGTSIEPVKMGSQECG